MRRILCALICMVCLGSSWIAAAEPSASPSPVESASPAATIEKSIAVGIAPRACADGNSLRRMDHRCDLAYFPHDPGSRKTDEPVGGADEQSTRQSNRAHSWSHLATSVAAARHHPFATAAETAGELDLGNAEGIWHFPDRRAVDPDRSRRQRRAAGAVKPAPNGCAG